MPNIAPAETDDGNVKESKTPITEHERKKRAARRRQVAENLEGWANSPGLRAPD